MQNSQYCALSLRSINRLVDNQSSNIVPEQELRERSIVCHPCVSLDLPIASHREHALFEERKSSQHNEARKEFSATTTQGRYGQAPLITVLSASSDPQVIWSRCQLGDHLYHDCILDPSEASQASWICKIAWLLDVTPNMMFAPHPLCFWILAVRKLSYVIFLTAWAHLNWNNKMIRFKCVNSWLTCDVRDVKIPPPIKLQTDSMLMFMLVCRLNL